MSFFDIDSNSMCKNTFEPKCVQLDYCVLSVKYIDPYYIVTTNKHEYYLLEESIKYFQNINENKDVLLKGEEIHFALNDNILYVDLVDLIVNYCLNYNISPNIYIDKPLLKPFNEYLEEWQIEIFDSLDKDNLFALAIMCRKLGYNLLTETICAKIAYVTKDMSVENMRDYFGIVNNFTPEDEKKMKTENNWP